ncbi:DUF1507 family protein [Latilactobacillus sakei subsp. sakei]|uniref:DUF1507 family protein n=1 Tax=Latilactobacillus sakei TaxID=1599 RepID=UPI0028672049|nr:DUF1507 family protein [Latilactobacillus sakei]MDR7923697.1 DUF1507 family protein [Latilactobacillus sakei subsp. sakei]
MMIKQETIGYMTLKSDAAKIEALLTKQFDALCLSQCPIIEEIIDTQLFGFTKEVDFAKRIRLISDQEGSKLVNELETRINQLYLEIYQTQAQNEVHRN